jgi:hypothetical protein
MTRIGAGVGEGGGDGLTGETGGAVWGARVAAAGGGGSTGADTKTSAGLAAGVTIRATVCFVEEQVGNVAIAAPAAVSARSEGQRRERFIGGSLVALGVYPDNGRRKKRRSGPRPGSASKERKAPSWRRASV